MSIRLARQLLLAADGSSGRVSLADVEKKLRELGGTAESIVADAAPPAIGALVALAAIGVAAVYVLGRRRGRRSAPVLEIRRI